MRLQERLWRLWVLVGVGKLHHGPVIKRGTVFDDAFNFLFQIECNSLSHYIVFVTPPCFIILRTLNCRKTTQKQKNKFTECLIWEKCLPKWDDIHQRRSSSIPKRYETTHVQNCVRETGGYFLSTPDGSRSIYLYSIVKATIFYDNRTKSSRSRSHYFSVALNQSGELSHQDVEWRRGQASEYWDGALDRYSLFIDLVEALNFD